MKSMTYGILPSFEEFEIQYNKECQSGDYTITKDSIVGNRTFTSAKEMYDFLIWLVIKWNLNDDNCQMEEYGSLASCILDTLNFEWV